MDIGIIASRYARALLKYVAETGEGEVVCAQAAVLERALTEVPELSELLDNPETVTAEMKMNVFETALGKEKMADGMARFIRMVLANGRIAYLRLMLHDFIDYY
ncbi:MAG: F0F1 ATP synthase subunit delta, partial [Acutalibacteraceae bacterium]|nr:F0F1 ATP synthase subunit delta [Acutalibacteraceae bacterium]